MILAVLNFSVNLLCWKDELKIHTNKFKMFSGINLMTLEGMLSAPLLSFDLEVKLHFLFPWRVLVKEIQSYD